MDIIDLTASSPATRTRATTAARSGNRSFRGTAFRPETMSRPHPFGTQTASRPRAPPSRPQPSRQLRNRAAAAASSSSIPNSLGTTPSNTTSSTDSPGVFLTDSDDDDEGEEFDSMEEYLHTNEAYLSSEDSSLDSDATADMDDIEDYGDYDEDSDIEDEDEDEIPEPAAARPIAPAISRTRPRTTSNANVTAPSRATTANQAPSRPPPTATTQPAAPSPQTNHKRTHPETKMPTASSPASKKAKTEPLEVVDMINVENDDDIQKIMHEQMIKTQREEGNARRRIADFKCVICLDDPENLSATSCGHLFCNDCIKTTLRFGRPSAKLGKCPVCRGKVVIKEIVPLELKLIKRVEGKGKGKA
ncbi:hypothetical protein AOL_s00215g178 [Orbilia oligospora ATCC 24927]|uniref:RING-type domain-containing protein n=2 Tax=Orbilia oligospora TaxID=2813651 RepID=G1XTP9_ARTOA|nr:hypothetical protein AOL_s00215g178 [Orbilia oligospora ATCC 24927]EGX43442.1 hypothetical protein AOL_s00215g178 [Orbilia oligospora ATCC 24927]KAF3280126.1 SUMO-targeted ubiquitin ligase complex subunit slx8 [Orbilia oligospora]